MAGFGAPKKTSAVQGDPKFLDDERASTPGTEQELINYTVPVNTRAVLHTFRVTNNRPTIVRVYVQRTGPVDFLVGSAWAGPSGDAEFSWFPGREQANDSNIVAGDKIIVKGKSISGNAISTLRTHLMLALIPV